jgi:PKD repeat protein
MRRPAAAAVACVVHALAAGAGCRDRDSTVAPTLVATCEARPATGDAPLPVSFLLGISGAEGAFSVSIAYGDGSTGTNPDASHTYTAPGSYLASFTVSTPTQSARCSTTVTVGGMAGPTPPPSGQNQPPNPVFKTNPTANASNRINGTAPFTVNFNMCQTSDPESDRLYFLMDFDGDRSFDSGGTTGAACRKEFTYAAGTWKPQICVHDRGPDGHPLHDDQCQGYTVNATP